MAAIDLGGFTEPSDTLTTNITTNNANRAIALYNHSKMGLQVTMTDASAGEVPAGPFTLGPGETFLFLKPTAERMDVFVKPQHSIVNKDMVPESPSGMDHNYPTANAQFFLTEI